MITEANKEEFKNIKWTEAAETSFERIKTEINNCQKLFYMDTTLTIVLCRDASDYAISVSTS
jgi:hypothetical protein